MGPVLSVRFREMSVLLRIGSFSIDDGDGRENVTFKMNWRFSKLCRVYSSSLKMSIVGKFRRRLFTSSIKREIGHFHVVVVQ